MADSTRGRSVDVGRAWRQKGITLGSQHRCVGQEVRKRNEVGVGAPSPFSPMLTKASSSYPESSAGSKIQATLTPGN